MADAKHYDVAIVGGGVAGCALAYALSTITSKSWSKQISIALLERSLAEPDRIVGELLQPGGVIALRKLGMEECLEGIGAIPVKGYCVVQGGEQVHIPYPEGYEGRSFHHGRFIQALRSKARTAVGVDVIEATVQELVENEKTGRVTGVRATRKGEETKTTISADLVVMADGCFSNFRSAILGDTGIKPALRSHFIGAIMKDAKLPIDNHGTVALVEGSGPVLMYQIAEHDTRILIDIKHPLPNDLKGHILSEIVPKLPAQLHEPIREALERERLRRMPNSFLPAAEQGGQQTKEGVVLIGDAWNMRHPLTGGGMTVAFNDVVVLSDLLRSVKDLSDWNELSHVLHSWHWSRKPIASTVNILSVALYDLFGADDERLEVLRTGCFKYFECGGRCVSGPVSLLSAIGPSPTNLFLHFFAVAFYAIWVMFTHPRKRVVSVRKSQKTLGDGDDSASSAASTEDGSGNDVVVKPVVVMERPGLEEYPYLALKSVRVFWTACVVFGPLVWSEFRWW